MLLYSFNLTPDTFTVNNSHENEKIKNNINGLINNTANF